MKKNAKTFIVTIIIITLLILVLSAYLYFTSSSQNQITSVQNTIPQSNNRSPDSANQDKNTAIPTTAAEILTYKKGLFSWVPNTIMDYKKNDLFEIIDLLQINEVYQYFEITDASNEHAKEFAEQLQKKNVDLYILAGASDWTYHPDGEPMLNEIQRALTLRNEWGENSIKGIIYDIEPYDSKKWINGKQDILMQNYISGMKIVYETAKENNLRIILCIPAWFDTEHNDTLLELVKYCDELSVMNYNRPNEYNNIIYEINLAKKYGKDITCIFEFQAVGKHNLTDEQTYYNYGVDAAQTNFENIYKKAGYSNLKFAYHYLEPLKELVLQK